MIRNTFAHIPGIGQKTEERFWSSGIYAWDMFPDCGYLKLSAAKRDKIITALQASRIHLENRNPDFFVKGLPAGLHWRIFPDFRDLTAYVDIETTGLDVDHCSISTIALYDGHSITTYVQGRNLDDFIEDIQRYKVLVTYNGKCFDIPVIEKYFHETLNHAQIDLRFVLASLGIKGGLKACEIKLGIDRGDLHDVDGLFAVVLWKAFRRNNDPKALQTLLAYNIQDAVNLEYLMVSAFNRKLAETPFHETGRIPLPPSPRNPLTADMRTIERYKKEHAFLSSLRPQW